MSAMRKLPDSHGTGRLRLPAYAIAGFAGNSFKHAHLPAILAEGTRDGFFEVHAENYLGRASTRSDCQRTFTEKTDQARRSDGSRLSAPSRSTRRRRVNGSWRCWTNGLCVPKTSSELMP
jgi:hypothetical protein